MKRPDPRIIGNIPGALRVWFCINFGDLTHIPVDSPETAARVIDDLANIQLKLDWITDNMFGLEVFREGEWEEWDSDDGEDIHEFAESLKSR